MSAVENIETFSFMKIYAVQQMLIRPAIPKNKEACSVREERSIDSPDIQREGNMKKKNIFFEK